MRSRQSRERIKTILEAAAGAEASSVLINTSSARRRAGEHGNPSRPDRNS